MSASVSLAVCGLHLRGQPLNGQLMSLGASFLKACRSSPHYKFFAITDPTTGKCKPGKAFLRLNAAFHMTIEYKGMDVLSVHTEV